MVLALAITTSVASGRTDIETARRQSPTGAEEIASPDASNAVQAQAISKTGTPKKATYLRLVAYRAFGHVRRCVH